MQKEKNQLNLDHSLNTQNLRENKENKENTSNNICDKKLDNLNNKSKICRVSKKSNQLDNLTTYNEIAPGKLQINPNPKRKSQINKTTGIVTTNRSQDLQAKVAKNNMKISHGINENLSTKSLMTNQTGYNPGNNPNNQKKKDINEMMTYMEKENEVVLRSYGAELYTYTKVLEEEEVSQNFLSRHKVNPEIRTKMVDWMIEVLAVYKSEAVTFSLAVYIMDFYLSKSTNVIKSDEIHLIGMTSMLIASKFEDVIPIRMYQMVNKIGHSSYTETQIKESERNLLETIGFDSLINTSIYEFIKTYFYDFSYNNREHIKSYKLLQVIAEFERSAVFLSKLMPHHEGFYKYKPSLKAVACIIAAYDIVRTNSKAMLEEGEKFIRDWIMFIIQECTFPAELIGEVYSKLVDYYQKYEKVTYINHNLTKYNPLVFGL